MTNEIIRLWPDQFKPARLTLGQAFENYPLMTYALAKAEGRLVERSLRAFSQRRPFKPFLVELASAARFAVDHPEALAQRGPTAVYINADSEYTLF